VASDIFGTGTELVFRDFVQGTWGSFTTPAGRVDYLMTKARLGEDSQDSERQLTKSLAPVREVMDAGDLDFNQLLQRDLDDHRVAMSLIPYLLTKQPTGPAFFPPIVAVLLPFKSKRPTKFPELENPTLIDADGMKWLQQRSGSTFQTRRFATESGALHHINLGQLWWNKSESSLVVLDGQHRAMALLAIERTLSKTWNETAGNKFRSFYETQVYRALEQEKIDSAVDLNKVEVPVTVCWFPEETGESAKPHEAARKLFVDVNKEARPPSESRIILLSDSELSNVLTRSILSMLRGDNASSYLPLYAVEYDHPETKTTQSARWSALTNINLLKMAVQRCVFGPRRYLWDVDRKFGGREPVEEKNTFMRKQLNLVSILPAEIDDGEFTYSRSKIGNETFPLSKIDVICKQFADTWGEAFLILLSDLKPYAAHWQALTRLRSTWDVVTAAAELAKDALFGGVGVYWTLRDSSLAWQEAQQRARESGMKVDDKTDAVMAWQSLSEKEETFEVLRAELFLGSGSKATTEKSKALYMVFNTHACQLGLFMTLGTLHELRKELPESRLEDLPQMTRDLVEAWNAFFAIDNGKARDRRYTFAKLDSRGKAALIKNPVNQIVNMDTPQAIYFRYFWLQALLVPEAWEHVASWFPNRALVEEKAEDARRRYLELCVDQQIRALRTQDPTMSAPKLTERARQASTKTLRKALDEWFNVVPDEFDTWLQKVESGGDSKGQDGQLALDEGDSAADDDAASEVEDAAQSDDPNRLEDFLGGE
jgi:hypothetical protein